MNHIHRIIFNRALGVYQAVSETARAGRGGSAASATATCVAVAAVALLTVMPAWAGGDGGYGGFWSDANFKGTGWTPGDPVNGSGGNGGNGNSGVGGSGGSVGQAGTPGGFSGGGGGSGGGGDGLVTSANVTNSGSLAGGAGGGGGNGYGGGGGGGGAGLATSGNVTNMGSIAGGDGGGSGDGSNGHTGGGGGGGAGLVGAGLAIVNSGSITGGSGGGTGSNSGGRGGAGSGGALGGTRSGAFGEGGAGIVGSHLSITHGGSGSSINGGLSGNGVRADAIRFTGGTNRLELQSGYSILGNVNANLGSNTLALGGSVNASFIASNIGSTAQFQGFSSYQKTGSSTWTLTGTTTAITPWTINAGILSIADNASLGDTSGGLTLNGGTLKTTAASMTSAREIALGAGGGTFDMGAGNLTLAGSLSGAGNLTQNGTGKLFLTGDNSGHSGSSIINNGDFRVGDGGTTGTLGTGAVTVASGANLVFNRSDNFTVANAIDGLGTLNKYGADTLTLSGANSHTGNTWIYGGALDVSDTLNSTIVKALGNATLTSSGVGGVLTGAVTIQDTAHLALSTGNHLTVGSLVLNNTANFDVGLGAPSTGNSPLLKVNGDVTLGGKLNVTDAGGFGTGTYRLIDYTGTLFPNGMTIGSVPATYLPGDLALQTSVAKQVNVVVNSPVGNLRFWNGSTTIPNGVVNGGNGTWNAISTNWTSANGTLNQPWANDFAVFQGAPGTVTVDGAQSFTGMQFATDGYRVQTGVGGMLNAVNFSTGPNAGTTAIRVDPRVTATLDLPIHGNGTLSKLDTGTLILSGANTYTGGTTVSSGVLQGNTSSLPGNIVNNANVTFDQSTIGSYAGTMSGSGSLSKTGVGELILSSINTYNGGTTVSGGTLSITSDANLGAASGALTLDGGTLKPRGYVQSPRTITLGPSGGSFDTAAGHLSLMGALSGVGNLKKSGANVLILMGDNSGRSGHTFINSGGLQVGNNSSTGTLGTGAVTVAAGADLGFSRSDDLTVANAIHGSGRLNKYTNGTLTLSGANPLTGSTSVYGGTLNVTGSLDSGFVSVFSGATLTGTGTLMGAATILAGGHLALSSGQQLTAGSLRLDSTSGVDAALGAPSTGGTSLLKINGDVTLGGNLNVTDAGGFGAGVYRLIDYTGSLLNAGMAVGTVPTLFVPGDLALQTAVAGQVNVLVGPPTGNLLFWNGSQTTPNGQVNGGSGTWNAASTNWTSANGTMTQTWSSDFAVFQGTADTVTVEGAQSFSGLQFTTDGYRLQAGAAGTLTAVNGASGSATIRVDPGATATLNVPIIGSGALSKLDMGTLVLAGANSYSGGTALKTGRLDLGHNSALGTGTLAMDDGTALGVVTDGLVISNQVLLTGNNDPVIDTGAFSLTLAGAISGAGFITKQGTGELTLSAANTYSGATDVAQGTLKAGVANALSSASAHSVAAGATLDLAGLNQSIAGMNLAAGGTVRLHAAAPGATPGTTLTVTGPWVGAGGTLQLSSALGGNSSPTDRLLLSGAPTVASGKTAVQITNIGGLGGMTTGQGIEIVATEKGASIDNSAGAAFTLAASHVGGHVDVGAYEYRLNTTANGGYLTSTNTTPVPPVPVPPVPVPPAPVPPTPEPLPAYRAEVPLFAALPAQLRQASLTMLGNLHQRVGDEGLGAAASAPLRQAWGRLLSTDLNLSQSGTVSPNSAGRLTGFQTGSDVLSTPNWRAGVYLGQLDGTPQVSGFASGVADRGVGSNDLHNQYLAAYGTYRSDSGFYADAVLQAGRHRTTLQPLGDMALQTKASSLLASLELGQTYALAGHWTIEPQLQFIHQGLSLEDSAISGAQVRQGSDSAWLVRGGLRVKGELATDMGSLQPYGRLNVYRASSGNDHARFVGPAGSADIATQTGYNSTELAAGATLALTPTTLLYGEVGKLFASGGEARVKSGVQASVGVRVRW